MLTNPPVRRRRKHSPEFKAELVALCRPGVSVAAVALENGVNANLLRRWIRQCPVHSPTVSAGTTLVPVAVSSPTAEVAGEAIEVSIQKNSARVSIRWPADRADACAKWLGSWLK